MSVRDHFRLSVATSGASRQARGIKRASPAMIGTLPEDRFETGGPRKRAPLAAEAPHSHGRNQTRPWCQKLADSPPRRAGNVVIV